MFVLRYIPPSILISSLARYLLKGVVLNFQPFVNFPVFLLLLISSSIFLLLLISSSVSLWLGKMPEIVLVFWNLLRIVLWPDIWSITDNILCTLERNRHSAAVEENVLCTSVMAICSSQLLLYRFSVWMIYYWMWDIEVFYYYCIDVYFSLQLYQCLFYISRCSYVGCIYNCCVLLIGLFNIM